MKLLFSFIFLFVILCFSTEAKDIHVNFVGKVDSIAIDSVIATNLTTNQKVTIPGNATLVLQDTNTHHIDIQERNWSTSLFPIPCLQSATLQLKSDITQEIKLRIIDLAGQTIFHTVKTVLPGVQSFSISCNDAGIYFVLVQKSDGSESFKFMQLQPGVTDICSSTTLFSTLNNQLKQNNTCNLKNEFLDINIISENSEKINTLSYKKGDIILFNCISGIYRTIITASPDSSVTITPEFVQCIDSDNNSYPTVKIGEQIWMGKNLTTTHYNNGELIPSNINDSLWVKLKSGASAIYLKDPKYIPNYGLLYNWYAVNDERGICPVGWHISSNSEWDTLLNYLGGPEIAGGKLKATGTEFWKEPNVGADNSSGFSALPSSGRNLDGVPYNDGHDCFYWMADEKDSTYAYNRYIYYNRTLVTKVFHTKVDGFAVRCVKDN